MADLTTLASVREYLQKAADDVEDDALISSLITRLSALVEGYVGRKLVAESGDNPITELKNGQGTPFVRASRYPMTALNELHQSTDQVFDATTLIASDDYIVDLDQGIVKLKGGIFLSGFRNVSLDYDQTLVVDGGLDQKLVEMVAKALNEKDNLGITSLSLKDGSMTKAGKLGSLFEENLRDMSYLIDYGASL